jgi:transcriptional regulator with XRE-family HTH domain
MAGMTTLTSRYKRISRVFGKRLKQARINANYRSAQKAAEALGLEPATYRTYERGSSLPNLEVLTRICELFRITPNDLLPEAASLRLTREDPPKGGYSANPASITD